MKLAVAALSAVLVTASCVPAPAFARFSAPAVRVAPVVRVAPAPRPVTPVRPITAPKTTPTPKPSVNTTRSTTSTTTTDTSSWLTPLLIFMGMEAVDEVGDAMEERNDD